MTDGRFETTFDLRPNGWDTRRHWTKTHPPFASDLSHVADHMERESCPFHDLRADGCFQPEYAGLGVEGTHTDPGHLVRRRDGNRMLSGGMGVQLPSRGVGGRPIPFDIVPGQGTATLGSEGLSRSGRPWTTTKKFRNLFSTFEHMAEAPEAAAKANPVKAFHTGLMPHLIGRPQKHVPVPYANPSHHSRPPFRLRAGSAHRPVQPRAEPRVEPHEYMKHSVSPSKRRPASAPRPPHVAHRPHKNTFQPHPAYIPDPWAPAAIRNDRRPLFTYAAKTKRCMPISVPWKAGLTSAEPDRPVDAIPRFAD